MNEKQTTLSLLEDLERNVESITSIFNLQEVIRELHVEDNKENLFTSHSHWINKPQLERTKEREEVKSNSKVTQQRKLISCLKPLDDPTPIREKKRSRKLTFRSSPLVRVFEKDEEEEEVEEVSILNSSTDSSDDIVTEFLSSQLEGKVIAPSMSEVEGQLFRYDPSGDSDCEVDDQILPPELVHKSSDQISQNQKSKLTLLRLEQQELIKQNQRLKDISENSEASISGVSIDQKPEDETDLEIEIAEASEIDIVVHSGNDKTPSTEEREVPVSPPKKTKSLALFDRLRSPSSQILKTVLDMKLTDDRPSSDIAIPPQSLPLEPAIISISTLTKERSKLPGGDEMMSFQRQLTDPDKETRFKAAQKILELFQIPNNTSFDSPIVKSLFSNLLFCLEMHRDQDERFNLLIIKSISKLGSNSTPALIPLLSILQECSSNCLREACLEALFSIGLLGFKSLIEICSEAATELDCFILTHIANHPQVVRLVIVPTLIRECSSPDIQHRELAVKALSKLGEKAVSALPSMLHLLLNGSVDRGLLVEAMKCCGADGERMLLILAQHKNSSIRECVARVLGQRCRTDCDLKIAVNTDYSVFTNPRILFHLSSSSSLGEFILLDARELLSMITRGLADNLYDSIGQEQECYIAESSVSNLVHQLSHKKLSIQKSIVSVEKSEPRPDWLLKYTRSSDEVQRLNPEDDSNDSVIPLVERKSNVNIMSHDCCTTLSSLLKDRDEKVRMAAAISISLIGLPECENTLDALQEGLKDPSNKVRSEVLNTFGKIGKQLESKSLKVLLPILRLIVSLLRDSHWNVRVAAVSSLTNFGSCVCLDRELGKQVIPLLLKLLKDGSVTRNEVSRCLMALGEKGVTQLINLMRQETQVSAQVRISAAYALSLVRIESPFVERVVECLFASSSDRIPLVRRSVVAALGTLGQKVNSTCQDTCLDCNAIAYLRPRSLLPFMYGYLKDRELCVREVAATVLANSGPHGELLLIEGLLKDSNTIIRSSAAYGLRFVGPRAIRSLLLALNSDREPSVVRSVAGSILSIDIDQVVHLMKLRPQQQRESVIISIREIMTSSSIFELCGTSSNHLRQALEVLKLRLERMD